MNSINRVIRISVSFLIGIAPILSACSPLLSKPQENNKETSVVNFKFENYKTEQEAKKQLELLFPEGTNLDEFTQKLTSLGAKCYDAKEGPKKSVFCHYLESGSFVKTKWIVGVDVDDKNRTSGLTVKRGFVGT
jgi:hypothetical protein